MSGSETTKKLSSFRLTPEMQQALSTASRVTGLNKTELVETCLQAHMPVLIKSVSLDTLTKERARAARKQAIADIKMVNDILGGKFSRPTPAQTAKKMAKAASAEIKKKRKK